MNLSLDPTLLMPGDIILTRSKSAIFSWIIRAFTLSNYSHAAIYIGRDTIIEAVTSGVRTQNVYRWSIGLKNNCKILRHPNQSIAKMAALKCEIYHGCRYSILMGSGHAN